MKVFLKKASPASREATYLPTAAEPSLNAGGVSTRPRHAAPMAQTIRSGTPDACLPWCLAIDMSWQMLTGKGRGLRGRSSRDAWSFTATGSVSSLSMLANVPARVALSMRRSSRRTPAVCGHLP